jgi:uncharacterized cupin superfamily protein
MKIVNTKELREDKWISPKGKFSSAGIEVSEALGRKPQSTDLNERQPFDVEICRIFAGKAGYPFHSHSAQWEFYHVISGRGAVRHHGERTEIREGDAFVFKPGEAHQLIADAETDLVLYVVADNPIGECVYFPDSNKWLVHLPNRQVIRSGDLNYYDGEE